MGLSDREQQLLDELERGLYATDSDLAHKLGNPGARSPKRIVAGGALLVIGLSLLVFAVMAQFALFGVVGFLVMLAGLVWATSSRPSLEQNQQTANSAANNSATKAKPQKSSNFFQDRWDKRRG